MVVTKLTYLTGFCILFIVSLIIIYFSKERIKSEETLIYKIMIFTNLIGLLLQVASGILSYNYYSVPPFITSVVIKL